MCTSTETILSCGHRLTSRVQRCKRPFPCLAPTTKTASLHNTCAKCDPEVHFHVIRTAYEEDHARLVRRYILAKAQNDPDQARRLEREIASLHRETRRKNATISTLHGDPDVLFP